ncbi:carcinoembryonic antigen-related cell adhesion molecule 20-like [Colossoma macropomum]|uniref:carcinoembryonic antigen-related cell adhesion molecule 20-like n=1 Tax=Colossoma macropomum TaxID=42526 RepID=UPI001864B6DA|nr:carcinoembryonic antigen-related cell adhesion molecule 20-like [Colossoma macropomum]
MDRVLVTVLAVVLLTESVSAVSIIGPEEVLTEDKSSANLTCVGTGAFHTAEWMKDDQILSPSNRIEFSTDNTTVLINPVKRTDSGVYRCTLRNNVTSETANYSMTVNYGPQVRILGVSSVEEGSDILLFCSAVSLPAASVTWTVNGATAGHSELLIIENSNHTHSGTYNCTAFNSVTGGTASAALVLAVTGKGGGPGLSPGEAAGITVAVIVVLAGLAVGLYFLIIHLKNSPEPLCKIPKPKKNNENRTQNNDVQEEDELKTTEFKCQPQQTSQDMPRPRRERPEQHFYENYNNKPPVPRIAKPSHLPGRVTDFDSANQQRSPELDRPRLPPRPDNIFKNDSHVYNTKLKLISNDKLLDHEDSRKEDFSLKKVLK